MLVHQLSVVNIVKFQLVMNTKFDFSFEHLISIKGQSNACSSFPCYNGGSCTPAGPSFLCTCKQQYTGTQCLGTTSGMIINRY